MSNLTVNKVTTQASNVTQDIKELLLSGKANVEFINHDGDMVYTIQGVDDLSISAQGYITDKGVRKYPKQSNDTIYIGARKRFNALNISFKSLITLLNGKIPKGGLVLGVKDPSIGYAPHNLQLINKFNKDIEEFSILEDVGTQPALEIKQNHVHHELQLVESETLLNAEDLYTVKATSMEYVTEDGAVFPTKDIADWHQENVSEAKGLAQVVLDYNGGYQLAEKVYQEKVKYNKARPYVNFVDVMENDSGVVERKSKEVVKFKSFQIGGLPHWAHLFSDKQYTEEKAKEIIGMLSLAQEVYENLEKLSKDTV